ncbi:hypothetical protein DMI66_01525 [Escherichia coli]|nr:hypothetical protein [Escherichia coli]
MMLTAFLSTLCLNVPSRLPYEHAFLSGETMKLTLLSAMLMTAVVGITSANAADYKKLLLPPMQLIRG